MNKDIEEIGRMLMHEFTAESVEVVGATDKVLFPKGDPLAEVLTRKQYVDEMWEWECRGGHTSEYINEVVTYGRDKWGMVELDDAGNVAELEKITQAYFRELYKWSTTTDAKRAQLVKEIKNLKKKFLEVGYLVGHADYADAVEEIFNSGSGVRTYPFSESFDEVVASVISWRIYGEK